MLDSFENKQNSLVVVKIYLKSLSVWIIELSNLIDYVMALKISRNIKYFVSTITSDANLNIDLVS